MVLGVKHESLELNTGWLLLANRANPLLASLSAGFIPG